MLNKLVNNRCCTCTKSGCDFQRPSTQRWLSRESRGRDRYQKRFHHSFVVGTRTQNNVRRPLVETARKTLMVGPIYQTKKALNTLSELVCSLQRNAGRFFQGCVVPHLVSLSAANLVVQSRSKSLPHSLECHDIDGFVAFARSVGEPRAWELRSQSLDHLSVCRRRRAEKVKAGKYLHRRLP